MIGTSRQSKLAQEASADKNNLGTDNDNSSESDDIERDLRKSQEFGKSCNSWDFDLSSRDDETAADFISKEEEALAAKETRAIRRLKFIVMLILLASMGLVGWAVFSWTSGSEQREFEQQFQEDSKKVLATLGNNLERILEAMDAFSVSIVSLARTTKQTWPYVVIPDFAARAEKIRDLTGAVYINTYHSVAEHERELWELFTSLPDAHAWVNESLALQEANPHNVWPVVWNYTLWDVIHGYDEWDKEFPGLHGTNNTGPWLPLWQIMPVIPYDPPFNWDLNTVPNTDASDLVFETHKVTLSEAYLIHLPDADPDVIEEDIDEAAWISDYLTTDEDPMEPISDYYYPIIDNVVDQLNTFDEANYDVEANNVVALLSISVYWRDALKDILPDGSEGLVVVFENPCNPSFTYQIDGARVTFKGAGDHHEEEYNSLGMQSKLIDLRDFAIQDQSYSGRPLNDDYCPFNVTIYPSDKMKGNFTTKNPTYFTVCTVLIFAFTSAVFVLYDCYVERRHRVVNLSAVQNKTIVEALFPQFVRKDIEEEVIVSETPKNKLSSFLNDGTHVKKQFDDNALEIKGKPIAELFPQTTVMFADIAGFTAWSSVREPSQVFMLLETLYGGFDLIAKRRNVFKVETIGDCYVAVCGLPEPRKSHPLIMVKFAHDCREKMKQITTELETTLGPGTAELMLRTGLHSGPTTAGVLRGEKARFQLFGDTVNTASRMESNGTPGLIHVSQKTADLLISHGKKHWLTARAELVNAKGKGMLQTYFVEPVSRSGSVVPGVSGATSISRRTSADQEPKLLIAQEIDPEQDLSKRIPTLVNWNTQIFEGLLKEISRHRRTTNVNRDGTNAFARAESVHRLANLNGTVREEIVETVRMPAFDPNSFEELKEEILLSSEVQSQLRDYISMISKTYPPNAFHNFEHASHVMMSVVKLLQRISTKDVKRDEKLTKKAYYDYTFGISSDPLTKFAIAFAALIHDADHQGVPNGQLSKENPELATLYKNKSIAEQNSINVAWDLLMEPSFQALREAIYANDAELSRFRQLVVNCVIATDIFDAELKLFREGRWEKAFPGKVSLDRSSESFDIMSNDDWNRKATIVIEYIIQASDVAHTMQHWQIYKKWNGLLFNECYKAYKEGRADKDPSKSWYQGELWFFDNYIIPLAKKLKFCEVFGVACDEFLDFAIDNRKEWEMKGRTIVSELVKKNERTGVTNQEMNNSSSWHVMGFQDDDELSYENLKE